MSNPAEFIPVAKPLAQYCACQQEIDVAIHRVLDSGWYVLGREVEAFEKEFAQYIGVSHAIGVASGTDAVLLALRACNIGPGDEVITTPHTAVATVAAIELAGATPVLADTQPGSFLLDPACVTKRISARTKAIIPVHLFGHPADLFPMLKLAASHGLRIIEDCAQAHGAIYHGKRVGAWGDIGCFSFYPTKNLGAIGDGGAVVTNDARLAARLASLRQYGWRERYVSDTAGYNSRLDELQAAILRVKLRHLDDDNCRRVSIADRYSAGLSRTISTPVRSAACSSVFHLYVITCPERDRLQHELRAQGIGTAIHYPVPVHLQPAYRGRLGDSGSFPVAEDAAVSILSLPIYPELTVEQCDRVISAVEKFAHASTAHV